MASIREVSSIAEDLLCSVCLSIFQEPCMLGCGHNFCLSCLESVVPKGQHQGTCPECRRPFSLQEAARNRVLANLAEKARLLKLEEGAQSVGAGNWYFCEEHEEPLKLFCSEDEALACVICRDLPQHQGHSFLPVKNAVKNCQGKLKASLESLEDGMKWATSNQSQQQEAIEELESLSQHLYGHIFIEFESLRQVLDAKEQSMMDTVKQMKADNQAEMERRLEYLKTYESSHSETISRVRAALEETNEFALLKGIKELMGRIQDLGEENGEAEHEACAHDQGAKDTEDQKVNVNIPEGKDSETKSDEDAYGDAEEAQDAEDFVPVDPALQELEEWLDFESWKEMLESISLWESPNPDSSYWSPSAEEDMFQPGDSCTSEAIEEEATSEAAEEEDLICAIDVTSAEDEVASNNPLPSSSSDAALPMGRALHSPAPSLCTPNYFPVPVFQQIPLYNAVQRWGGPCRWRPSPRRGWAMLRSRGATVRPFLSSRGGHGRGFQSTFKPREAGASGQGRGWFNKQKLQSSGSSISGQSGGGKTQPPMSRGAPVSGRGGSGQGRGSAPSPGRGGSGQGRGSAPTPGRGGSGQGRGSAVGRGGSGQGRASAQKGPTHHSGGRASSNRGSWNRQASHHGVRGHGSGSAKGSRSK